MDVLDQPSDWSRYNVTQVDRRDARPLLQKLLNHAGDGRDRLAVDLGFGAGVETEMLLRRGWRVLAIDWDPTAGDLLAQRLPPELAERVTVLTRDFADIETLSRVDLVHACMALPFAGPQFTRLWQAVMAALSPGGWIGCELFGDRDTQAGVPSVAIHTDAEVAALLAELNVIELDTRERDGTSFSGPQHWHVHSVIGQKPPH